MYSDDLLAAGVGLFQEVLFFCAAACHSLYKCKRIIILLLKRTAYRIQSCKRTYKTPQVWRENTRFLLHAPSGNTSDSFNHVTRCFDVSGLYAAGALKWRSSKRERRRITQSSVLPSAVLTAWPPDRWQAIALLPDIRRALMFHCQDLCAAHAWIILIDGVTVFASLWMWYRHTAAVYLSFDCAYYVTITSLTSVTFVECNLTSIRSLCACLAYFSLDISLVSVPAKTL